VTAPGAFVRVSVGLHVVGLHPVDLSHEEPCSFPKATSFRTRQSSSGLDYCFDPNAAEQTVDTCKSDDDCLLMTCLQKPCLRHVCRNSRCVVVEQCGNAECDNTEFCCNPSCGLCSPMGSYCSQEVCEGCGDSICNVGDVCCNPDCGICASSLGSCPESCNTAPEGEAAPTIAPYNELLYCQSAADCVKPPCPVEPCMSSICLNSQCALAYECGANFCPITEICCDRRSGLCSEGTRCNEYWIIQEPGANGDDDVSRTDEVRP
jgi:hypothetical protein